MITKGKSRWNNTLLIFKFVLEKYFPLLCVTIEWHLYFRKNGKRDSYLALPQKITNELK